MGFDRKQLDATLKRAKSCQFPSFDTKPTNANYRVAATTVQDADGISIARLTASIEYRVPKVASRPKYHFTLFQRDRGRVRRLYQLEVQPRDKRSSISEGAHIHGPHEHFLEHEEVRAVPTEIDVYDYSGWLAEFARRANLTIIGTPPPPFGPDDEL